MSKHKKYTKEEFEIIYKDVVKLVKTGQNIRNAIESLGFNSPSFYRLMSTSQNLELQSVKTANTRYGISRQGGSYVRSLESILNLNNEY